MTKPRQFEFEPPAAFAWWLTLLFCLLPSIIVLPLMRVVALPQLAIAGAVSLLMVMILVPFMVASRRGGVELRGEGLRFRAPLYGRTVSLSALDVENARIVEVGKGSSDRPILRTNGFGLPGLLIGWCRLADRSKALVYRSRGAKSLRVPTHDGYDLLLEVTEPERLLAALRRD